MTELFDEPLKEVARYPYRSSDGLTFEKVRLFPKTFRWEPKLNGHKLPLYKISELPAGPVYLLESEKDVDRLLSDGVAATCMPGGAGNWTPEYSESLRDRDVIIVADRDEAGVNHAQKVHADLKGKARSVRIMQSKTLGEHDDIGDHLDAGFSLNEMTSLRPSTGARPYKMVSLSATMKRGVPDPVLLCDGLLYEGGLHSIAGAPDAGKTTLALFWAVKLLQEGRPVLFLDEEGGAEIVCEKLMALGASASDLESLAYVPFPGRSWTDEDVEELLGFTQEISPAMMLVDSSAAFLARAGLDENSAPAVTSWWSRVLTPIARDIGSAVLVIDHDTKSSEVSRYARGSGAKLAALDVQLKVTMVTPFTREQEGNLKVVITKDRRGWLHRHWNVDVHTGAGVIQPEFTRDDPEQPGERVAESSWPPARRFLYEALTASPQSSRDLVDTLVQTEVCPKGLKRETCSRELNKLADDGFAQRFDQGPGRDALWSLPVTSRDNHEEIDRPF
jgi:hypothetical protein